MVVVALVGRNLFSHAPVSGRRCSCCNWYYRCGGGDGGGGSGVQYSVFTMVIHVNWIALKPNHKSIEKHSQGCRPSQLNWNQQHHFYRRTYLHCANIGAVFRWRRPERERGKRDNKLSISKAAFVFDLFGCCRCRCSILFIIYHPFAYVTLKPEHNRFKVLFEQFFVLRHIHISPILLICPKMTIIM